ncbi:transporter substrate-binding domain-containing protein [Bradyrhizobium sp. WSM 1704]|uniref:transporter substrate-binding domain-containing protein n=1 Tax=Bradyrhizobium semiaridum TaxID=2821404 RepID=UPI001CE35426|nr:transporter substrate-binding domain-containing protein [Bradyrhizobium semiaridum]MCA6121982.1 transporter substrate-binding domain-containing protein [Bradyrhizobium semiaridum]
MRFVGRRFILFAIAGIACLAGPDIARAQVNDQGELSIELIDPKVLRICADPRNLPFSNEKGEGFENKIGELLAEKLQKRLDYMFFPQATGFVRMTLGSHRCDVIMGFPQGDELAQATNPYYRTAYALVAKPGSGLEDVSTLEDERLKGKHIGIVAGTPPATNMAGVRSADQAWKRQLNKLIQENQPAINKILLDFGVPLLDENNRPIGPESANKSP